MQLGDLLSEVHFVDLCADITALLEHPSIKATDSDVQALLLAFRDAVADVRDAQLAQDVCSPLIGPCIPRLL